MYFRHQTFFQTVFYMHRLPFSLSRYTRRVEAKRVVQPVENVAAFFPLSNGIGECRDQDEVQERNLRGNRYDEHGQHTARDS